MCAWSVQGYDFTTDLKLLPMSSFDMILGLDWLASFSPMQVDWVEQWISIPYQGRSALLMGTHASLPAGSVVQLCLVQDIQTISIPAGFPIELLSILMEFYHLFRPPKGLPTQHSCDHTIPLIEGAQPVFTRPYRYAPLLKSEIERQVTEML